jgi:DNA-binding transcriptional ArsR family regulator
MSDLSDEIRGVIDRYLSGHRSRSLSSLSRASGVSYTTLRRLYQREGNPTAEPVLKIVDAALTNDEKIEFINRHYPELADTINKFQRDAYASASSRQEALKTVFMRDPHNFILNLAQNSKGTTREDVNRLTGERGLEALDELVECELLERSREGQREVFRLAPLLSHDCDMALAQIKLSADHFDRSLIGTKAARVFHATSSIRRQALEQIHDVVSAAIQQIMTIKDDPRNAGEIPIFVDMLMSVYDKRTLSREENDP